MSHYLEPVEDQLPMRPAKGAWVAEKLDYVARYLDMFVTSMSTPRQKWRALRYIDLFAGPGKCQEDDGTVHLGSPLLALTARRPFTHYAFVDLDASHLSVLEQRCSASVYYKRCQFFPGDSNEVAHDIVAHIKREDQRFMRGVWPSLNLAFLDPEGLELEWETVAALAEVRTDLIIHYSQMGLERCMPNLVDSPEETIVDRFFGSRQWRDIFRKWCGRSRLHRKLIDFYKGNLRELGYVEVKGDDGNHAEPLMRNIKNAPLYRLLFASKHPLGEKFWREVNKRNVYGQGRLL
jgi:three-Cys-motif partner protein